MKIVHCPKGGRVPDRYCRASCLNYPGKIELEKHILGRKPNEDVSPSPIYFAEYSQQLEEVETCVYSGD